MEISKIIDGENVSIALHGRLDTSTAPQLEKVLEDLFSEKISQLVFDFEKLEYLSSAGLRVLLKAQKEMNKRGSMKITHVNDDIMEVFDITGFLDILTVE